MVRIKIEVNDQMIWYMLAELFFIDSDASARDFDYAAKILLKEGWTREKTRQWLIERVAPAAAGGGFKYYLWPAVSEWGGIDRDKLARRIEKQPRRRARYPKFVLRWIDRLNERLLEARHMEKLLKLLDPPEEDIPLSQRKSPGKAKKSAKKKSAADEANGADAKTSDSKGASE